MSMARTSRPPPVAVDVVVEAGAWGEEDALAPAIEAVVAAALARKPATVVPGAELAVILTDDAAIRKVNREHRGVDKPTNVLSFPISDPDATRFGPLLGDILVARETVAREAAERGWSLDHYLAHMVVHGFLHLLGYDHQIEEDAERMERLEAAILADLGIDDPFTPIEDEPDPHPAAARESET